MSTMLHLLRGQMSSLSITWGGRCPHISFFMFEGGNVRLPCDFYNLNNGAPIGVARYTCAIQMKW